MRDSSMVVEGGDIVKIFFFESFSVVLLSNSIYSVLFHRFNYTTPLFRPYRSDCLETVGPEKNRALMDWLSD